ncbi:MAG: DUF2946 family protein [Pseudomonadota bacterium]
MLTPKWFNRSLVWLLLCALSFAALAPSTAGSLVPLIARWLGANQQTLWVNVCSVAGNRRVALNLAVAQTSEQQNVVVQSRPSPRSTPDLLMPHCPLCLLQSALLALPGSDSLAVLTLRPLAFTVPSAPAPIASSGRVTSAHRARAPPSPIHA